MNRAAAGATCGLIGEDFSRRLRRLDVFQIVPFGAARFGRRTRGPHAPLAAPSRIHEASRHEAAQMAISFADPRPELGPEKYGVPLHCAVQLLDVDLVAEAEDAAQYVIARKRKIREDFGACASDELEDLIDCRDGFVRSCWVKVRPKLLTGGWLACGLNVAAGNERQPIDPSLWKYADLQPVNWQQDRIKLGASEYLDVRVRPKFPIPISQAILGLAPADAVWERFCALRQGDLEKGQKIEADLWGYLWDGLKIGYLSLEYESANPSFPGLSSDDPPPTLEGDDLHFLSGCVLHNVRVMVRDPFNVSSSLLPVADSGKDELSFSEDEIREKLPKHSNFRDIDARLILEMRRIKLESGGSDWNIAQRIAEQHSKYGASISAIQHRIFRSYRDIYGDD